MELTKKSIKKEMQYLETSIKSRIREGIDGSDSKYSLSIWNDLDMNLGFGDPQDSANHAWELSKWYALKEVLEGLENVNQLVKDLTNALPTWDANNIELLKRAKAFLK